MTKLYSLGLGVGTNNSKGDWLEVFYPQPLLNPDENVSRALADALDYRGGNRAIALDGSKMELLATALENAGNTQQAAIARAFQHSRRPLVATLLETDAAPASVPEGYLKLHLISHRLVKPHGTDLSGLFGVLPNVAWTSQGAIDLEELPERQLQARLQGDVLEVACVDKFPKMTNYVVPAGVRIAHTARVRLGAYLGEGTTVMHEGFVNFNAGTAGPGMIEGRISAGVFVGAGSDLGGGCSTMGTLSGGGDIVISVGAECLLGANAGVGIPLGDRCTVEAGLYITAGTKVTLLDDRGEAVEQIKARDLAGKSDLLFRRNSTSGAVECKTNKSAVALNAELHAHN
ncbi:2,3,4,5-tetrahydropyridine-2,6-dicarboxylate N-succinyltransferase [Exilibacterium tricleocarpae]|uniref:2,3,4,5-tetrahydropyridine-2,6-dicarboxylate N-succinyltransferase n=1 Tax=Exilibacterium tricleocarpae TaxID=2591008 RepID=A0A545U849_9GAMM|nr:2,3,4,5-tetrahydropyridine-2,6-dicarboxylate N-succinyltransferase [Exilibacterium tricleocarpae]TQV85641.1 2,3,4,5-tetrahydropyridine-2,6-dicarboxylate N-succinyltransferase [Exilibacterium tricleocarpae]